MKKIIGLTLAILLLVTGCGEKSGEDVVKSVSDKVSESSSYNLKGNMEIYTNEETFTYSIEVDFLKDNFYKVKMVNQTNNHEQIILRNSDAVYVITPSLNKSFKFQSEWPENSSQAYILASILSDINNDSSKTIEEVDGSYVVKSVVNYPNNPDLAYQKTTMDKDGNLKKNEIYNDKDELKMKVTFTSIDYKASLKEEDFVLEQYITEDTEENTDTKEQTNTDTEENTPNNQENNNTTEDKSETDCEGEACKEEETENGACEGDACTEETGSIENILYPLYVPSNTYLSSSDKVNTDVGDRIILTFAGDKNFVLVEEAATVAEEFEIIPVYGDPLIVNDTIGALGANSLSWTKDNISYYLTGTDLSTEELLTIGESIGYNNQTVSLEK
ncbi:TPA: outer membrane lipoprotein carrier protein LolA [Candidatus Ventrenecus avicola]|nr:outer membrane lipoprotein carrier protein LolA [Candidatus Ventrenecus avicola]